MGIGAAHQADEAGARHVGGVERQPDEMPGQGAAGQEVALRRLLLTPADMEAVREDADEVDEHDGVVDPVQLEAWPGHRRPPSGAQCASSESTRIGRSRMRRPVAWYTALAIAAAVPTLPSSPRPLTPAGFTSGSSSGTRMTCR